LNDTIQTLTAFTVDNTCLNKYLLLTLIYFPKKNLPKYLNTPPTISANKKPPNIPTNKAGNQPQFTDSRNIPAVTKAPIKNRLKL
jgi:hypothetical protein